MNRFVLEDEDIIILGEKEKNDVGSNNLGGNSFDNGDSSNISDGTPTKSLNKRMDSKGMLHNTDGKYVAKAGLTGKPNWKAQVIEELSGADSSKGETNG